MSELYGKYRLLELIASSRAAEVFRAKSHGVEGFEKVVVIKRLRRAVARVPGYIEAFIEEAKAAVKLSHANLVQVFDLGQVDRTFYLAMEHVNGPDLGEVMERAAALGRPLPVDLAIHLVCEVVKALDYTHRRKDYQLRPLDLAHGGVHPWNILISRDGEVKLTSFGALRLLRLLPQSMWPPAEAWTPFLAPELRRDEGVASQQADVFAAGALLAELLQVGRPRLDSALEGLTDLPAGLPEILRRTLSPDLQQRQAKAGELYESLVALLFHAGLKPSNRALGSYLVELLAQPLPEGTTFALRETPAPPAPSVPPGGTPGQPPALPTSAPSLPVFPAAPPPPPPPPPPSSVASLPPLSNVKRPVVLPGLPLPGGIKPPPGSRPPAPPPPPPGPRRAPVVAVDPGRAVPALPETRTMTPLARPAPQAGEPPVRSTPPPAARPGDIVWPVTPSPPPLPGNVEETVRGAPLPPLAPPPAPGDAGGRGPWPAAPPPLPVTPVPATFVPPAGPDGTSPAPRLVLAEQVVAPPPPGPPDDSMRDIRDAAVLHLRAAGYASSVTFAEIEKAIERWGGNRLPSEPGTATVLFYSASLPVRALMRALHCALQLGDASAEMARYAIGVHSGPTHLDGEGPSLRPDPEDPVVRRAVELARAANPGEVLCSEVGPLLVGSEFSFSPGIKLQDDQVAHRVVHFLTVTTQRSSLVPELLRSTVTRSRLLGREAEVQHLVELVEGVRTGAGRILALEGGAGVGKSALVECLRRTVDTENVSWFHVRLFSGFGEVPYWGLRALLGAICAVEEEHPAAEVRNRLDRLVQLGLSADELSGVASVFALQRRGSSKRRLLPAVDPLASSDSSLLLAGTLRKVIAGLSSEQPLVLVLEDLEHLDGETWGLLAELSRQIGEWPVLLLITSRSPVPLGPVDGLERMVLGPPGEEPIRARIRRIARLYLEEPLDDAVVDELRQRAADNPRFAEELVRYLGESAQLSGWRPDGETPPTFHEVIERRLALVPPEEKEILHAAAAIGQLFGVGLLARVTRGERHVVEEVLQRAQRRGMVEPIGPGLHAFRHEVLPAILYGELLPDAARTLHERVAAQLEAAHPEDRGRFLEELAHHWSRAGNSDKALRYLEALADRMEAGHYYRAAIAKIQAASAVLAEDARADSRRRIDVLLRLGTLAIPAMDFALGRQAVEQALTLAQKTRQERKVPQCLFLQGRISLAAGEFDEALTQLERALKLGQGLRDRGLAAGIYGAIGEAYYKNGDLARAVHYLGQAILLADREGDTVLAGKMLLQQANCHAGQGSIAEAERALDKAVQLAGRGDELGVRSAVLKTRSLCEYFRRDFRAALATCSEGIDLAQEIGAVLDEAVFLHNAGDCLLRLGELARAHHYLSRSLELCRSHGMARYGLTNEILLGYVELLRHGVASTSPPAMEALATLEGCLARAEELHLVLEQIQARLLLGEVALARQDLPRARSCFGIASREARRIHLRFAEEEAEAGLARAGGPGAEPVGVSPGAQ